MLTVAPCKPFDDSIKVLKHLALHIDGTLQAQKFCLQAPNASTLSTKQIQTTQRGTQVFSLCQRSCVDQFRDDLCGLTRAKVAKGG